MRTLAVIPARGGSKRLPGKNIRPFLGVPLIAWSIRFALGYAGFDRVVVSTDAPDIAAVAAAEGIEVPRLRPPHLASDTAATIDAVLDVIDHEAAQGRQFDTVALLQPTSPIRLASRWDAARDLLGDSEIDAVVGVAPARTHPFHTFSLGDRGQLTSMHSADLLKLRGQDLPAAVSVAGNLYLARTAALHEQRTFFPSRIAGVLCDQPFEAADIDDELDWLIAETIATKYGITP
ncbi:acylneuraminate cytidylyltransferase family protein [Devosia oryziradicis]|uniref:Acylneuraminate cytidylyltransferase family protein n=1 Tax=Devosia oryziradicis TaxID=2801335 RepID=A0ABX7BU75_9HYPH|nr:acylneuraminate cytidylyltransferase family protein [Devosia oryziradicis]QQR35346.1 acylneuraminate cytidylyltransferase family protein [Devosia oryziradicis]